MGTWTTGNSDIRNHCITYEEDFYEGQRIQWKSQEIWNQYGRIARKGPTVTVISDRDSPGGGKVV